MSSRYFINLAYNGSSFFGWQIQPNVETVEGIIESQLSKLYNQPIQIVGCGRTDTGVHASDYFAHVDLPSDLHSISDLVFKLNNMLPPAVVIYSMIGVAESAHARFDAISRSYVYKMIFGKDPFRQDGVFSYNQSGRPDFEMMNKAASLLLEYTDFYPFCKSHADVENYKCDISRSIWVKVSDTEWHYHVTANRFLRGMVRLLVGMTINVGLGRLSLDELRMALKNQSRLKRAWSVPASGLYLSRIEYPYIS